MKIFVEVDNFRAPAGYYFLPDTALNRIGQPFFLPDINNPLTAFPALAVRISRLGKNIAEKFAHRYIDAVALAVVFRDENMLRILQQDHHPWTAAVSYDGVVNQSRWIPLSAETPFESFHATVMCNGNPAASFAADKLLVSPEYLVSKLSEFHKFCQGDIILTGSPCGFAARYNDCITGSLNGEALLRFNVK